MAPRNYDRHGPAMVTKLKPQESSLRDGSWLALAYMSLFIIANITQWGEWWRQARRSPWGQQSWQGLKLKEPAWGMVSPYQTCKIKEEIKSIRDQDLRVSVFRINRTKSNKILPMQEDHMWVVPGFSQASCAIAIDFSPLVWCLVVNQRRKYLKAKRNLTWLDGKSIQHQRNKSSDG